MHEKSIQKITHCAHTIKCSFTESNFCFKEEIGGIPKSGLWNPLVLTLQIEFLETKETGCTFLQEGGDLLQFFSRNDNFQYKADDCF